MDVLLLNPPVNNGGLYVREGRCQQSAGIFVPLTPQITLASIASVLEGEGFRIDIKDCMATGETVEHIKDYLKKNEPKLVVMNVSTPTFNSDATVAKIIKRTIDTTVAAIGVHVTSLPNESLKFAPFDICIRGEAELTALELAKSVIYGNDLSKVRSISYMKNGKVHNTPDRLKIADLDSLPFPARHLLPNSNYRFPITGEKFTTINVMRGCPYRCIFCTAKALYGSRPRYRSARSIVREIKQLWN